MSKPEFWWCVKHISSGTLYLGTVGRTKQIAKAYLAKSYKADEESIVRIRVEEVPEKKGGRR